MGFLQEVTSYLVQRILSFFKLPTRSREFRDLEVLAWGVVMRLRSSKKTLLVDILRTVWRVVDMVKKFLSLSNSFSDRSIMIKLWFMVYSKSFHKLSLLDAIWKDIGILFSLFDCYSTIKWVVLFLLHLRLRLISLIEDLILVLWAFPDKRRICYHWIVSVLNLVQRRAYWSCFRRWRRDVRSFSIKNDNLISFWLRVKFY